jgi:5-formyltetrahydrofolate cyclo-ligase
VTSDAPRSSSWDEIKAWRKRTREALIAQRQALAADVRRAHGQRATQSLAAAVDLRQFGTIGIYWPIRGEMDVRELARRHSELGGRIGLPVVVARAAPVQFWRWQPGSRMRLDLGGIPVPAESEIVYPDALIVPLVGFDAVRYRLGYGGGYYDRTIAAALKRPFCIGIGYEAGALDTIWPQPHDMGMDIVITEQRVLQSNGN